MSAGIKNLSAEGESTAKITSVGMIQSCSEKVDIRIMFA